VEEEILKKVNSVCILKIIKNKLRIIEKLETQGFEYVFVKRCSMENEEIIYDKEEMLKDKDYMSLIYARRT
jgi:precorrin-2/cobalt-factor-2 C20-methyltransferase